MPSALQLQFRKKTCTGAGFRHSSLHFCLGTLPWSASSSSLSLHPPLTSTSTFYHFYPALLLLFRLYWVYSALLYSILFCFALLYLHSAFTFILPLLYLYFYLLLPLLFLLLYLHFTRLLPLILSLLLPLPYLCGQALCVARKFTGTFPANFMMIIMMMIDDLQWM